MKLETMAFSSWFSRFRSSSSSCYHFFCRGASLRNLGAQTPAISKASTSQNGGRRFLFWSSSVVPFALASGSLAYQFQFQSNSSLCDDSDIHDRNISVGGKGSTKNVVQGSHNDISQAFIEELGQICKDNMTLDYDERYFHGKPQNSFHTAVNIPDVVVFPRSEVEVSEIVKLCDQYKVPIVPYGGATSIEGHTLAPNGGLCIDMSLMNKVKALHVEDMDVIVEPGIGWMELNEYLEPYGLFFPLDPGPGATIGGMCATRCSGSLAVR